jgi:hypothetical protein
MTLTEYIQNQKFGFDVLELVDGSIIDAVEYENQNRKILVVHSKLILSDNSTTISGITTSANLFESGLHNFGGGFPEISINKLCVWDFCCKNNLKIVHVVNSFPEEQIFVESGQNEIETEEEREKYFQNIKSIFINKPKV